jgi:hypothetical protein
MAFLQRIVNGEGRVHREYALGTDRVDILITWPFDKLRMKQAQRIVVELKIWHSETKTMIHGLEQTARYIQDLRN